MAKKPKYFPKKKNRKEKRLKRKALPQKQIRKALLKYDLPKVKKVPQLVTLFDKINYTLDYIKNDKNKNYNQTLSMNLMNALKSEMGVFDYKFKKGENNSLFSISPTWNGNINTLISNITIKKDFKNKDAITYLNKIVNSNWGDEQKYSDYIESARSRAYKTLTSRENIQLPSTMFDILEQIMNSSEMWHIVGDQYGLGSADYDSNQAKESWTKMHKKVDKLLQSKKVNYKDIEKFINDVKNFDEWSTTTGDDYKKLVDEVDDIFRKYRG